MSNKLHKGGNGRIVNPFAKPILTLVIDDQGNTNLQSPMHPKDTCKALANVMIETMFQYMEAITNPSKSAFQQQEQQQSEEKSETDT